MRKKKLENIFNEEPDSRLWSQLEAKLDNKKASKKLRLYRIASVAALFAAVVASLSYFNHFLQDHNPHLFASNEDFSGFILEELEEDTKGLFNVAFFDEILSAYKENALKDVAPDILGDYQAKDGEISFTVGLDNFQFQLEFSYTDFPVLELVDMNGQTLYFESSDGSTLKLNRETYGFQLLESSFLPEYKNYIFKKLQQI